MHWNLADNVPEQEPEVNHRTPKESRHHEEQKRETIESHRKDGRYCRNQTTNAREHCFWKLRSHLVIFWLGKWNSNSDAGWAMAPRRRVSGPSPRGLLALHKKEFQSKPFSERDKDLVSIEVKKGATSQSSGLSFQMGKTPPRPYLEWRVL